MEPGLPVVLEGRRIRLRVYRRFFYPVSVERDGQELIVYADTGRQKEIRYEEGEGYGLDNPWRRMALVRLARAMECLECEDEGGEETCTVTICRSKELYNFETEEAWVPFNPARLKPLEERIKEAEERRRWASKLRDSE